MPRGNHINGCVQTAQAVQPFAPFKTFALTKANNGITGLRWSFSNPVRLIFLGQWSTMNRPLDRLSLTVL